ncbi:MAG: VWA domain-containing protein [Myxococcales bacterium]|nr:VWA domain-containing protein [Myxococcales bacterium]
MDLAGDSIVRFELDVATMLGDAPRDLATVLIVDGSRSISDDDREAQRALVESYLDKAPGSRVQVVAVARTAQAVLPAWTGLRRRTPRWTQRCDPSSRATAPTSTPGSREAATWLRRLDGTRRVVLVTDERMATRLAHASDTALRGILPPGTLLHVVVLSSGSGLQRDDEAKLASLARSTEGFAVRLGTIPDDDGPDATMLVRPISIDRFSIVAPGWDSLPRDRDGPPCDDEMDVHEGHGCTWWRQHHGVDAPPITVEGWIWGTWLPHADAGSIARARRDARAVDDGPRPERAACARRGPRAGRQRHVVALRRMGGTAGYDGPFGGGTGFGAICGCGRIGTTDTAVGPDPGWRGRIHPASATSSSRRSKHARSARRA